ncbi:MAG: DUF5026 domain-containing protein [Oscillospiraceae bacterium]|nr:DUF5026 domain-containing protein [Oscillospiraceae bacterium]
MALIMNATHAEFDLAQIRRGDCIRVKRTGDTTAKNGFVTEAATNKLRLLYCNTQNNAASYLEITAADVAVGVWEIYWTQDFQTVNYENNAPQPEA